MGKTIQKDKVYERLTSDLPINAVVSATVVDDPLERGAKLRVIRSLRDDPLAGMKARGQIDEAQYQAGRLWQKYQEDSEIGGIRAIDPTKEAVDGGGFKEPDITRMSVAMGKLKGAAGVLQAFDLSLLHDVLTRNMTITQIAAARSITSGRQISATMDRFRDALDILAVEWKLSMRKL